jgi:PAS domain S-box-containing protein
MTRARSDRVPGEAAGGPGVKGFRSGVRERLLPLSVLAGVVAALCAVTWAGVLTLDTARALVRSEALYVSHWGLAFGHLDGFARSSDAREYAKFERDLRLPLASMEARVALTAPDASEAEVRALLVRSGIDPADVRAVRRLYRLWEGTRVGARYLAARAAADREVIAIRDLGRRLRRAAAAGPLDSAQVAGALHELAHAEGELQRHSQAIHTLVAATARQVRDGVLVSLFASAVLILGLAGALGLRLVRGVARSEAWFRTLFESAADARFVYRLTPTGPGPFTAVNQAALGSYGYTREELLRMQAPDLHAGGPEGSAPPLARLRSEGTVLFEAVHRTKDGREVPVEVHASLHDVGGERFVFSSVRDVSARVAAERALRESEARFRATFENAAVGIANTAPDGAWLRVNDRLCEILGYPREELLARTFQQVTHPDDLEANLALLGEALGGARDSYALEKRFLHRDGHAVWVHLTASLLRTPAGAPLYLISVIEDISERKRADEALRWSEQQLGEALDAGHVFTYDWDLRTDVVTRSASAAAVLGLPPGTTHATGAAFFDAVHPDDRTRIEALLPTVRPDQPAVSTRVRYRRPDGVTVVLEETARAFFDAEGRVVRFAGLAADVTERARAEEALRESEGRFRQIAENLAGALWMLDVDTGQLLYASPASERLWSLPVDVIKQGRQAVLTRVHEEDRARVAAVLAGPITDRTSVDFRLGADGGETRWLRSSVFPIRDDDGVAYRVAGYTEDITAAVRYREEREARARAEDALHVKTAILRGVSEELRTPLTSILGFTALLKEGPIPEEAGEYAGIIERNARRLEEAVAGILEMAQVESGAIPLRPETLDIVAEVQEAAGLLRPMARAKGLELGVDAAARPIRGLADRGGLQRILRTLIDAGLKATNRGGVYLHVSATAADVELRVRDTGVGLDPAVLPYLFSGFHDAGWARDRSSVELALAKRLAEMLGGALHVESAPGQGTTFTLHLPLAPGPGPAAGDGAAYAVGAPG